MHKPWHTVVVPAYNERRNLRVLVRAIMEKTSFSVPVVDDASPDGSGRVADELCGSYPGRMAVLHRSPPRGLGCSYRDGFRRALELGAEFTCQTDADLSHDPRYLAELVRQAQAADVVVGSRYMTGISVANWPLHRLLLSLVGNAYVRTITGLRVRDVTSGFKCWRRRALSCVLDSPLISVGYALQFEMLFQATRAGFRVVESLLIFVERPGRRLEDVRSCHSRISRASAAVVLRRSSAGAASRCEWSGEMPVR